MYKKRDLKSITYARQINDEQKRQIEKYKWIESEKAGRDIGNQAICDWVFKYASSFRKWAKKIPLECIGCGLCEGYNKGEPCKKPFDPDRIKFLNK